MKNFLFVIFFCCLLCNTGCSDKKDVFQHFENYLQENFNQEPKERLYAILPVGTCKVCFDTTLEYLSYRGKNKQIAVILVGSTSLTLNLHKSRIIDFEVLMDSKNNFFKYDITDVSYPTLLEIKDNEVINVIHGESGNLIEIKRLIDSYY